MKKSREQRRNDAANNVCRELRFQMANNTYDAQVLFRHLEKWMKYARKDKYIRPVNPIER